MKAVLAVVGPTASGKTALAVRLAEHLDTEIVSADSMQFYRGMEIGTGAPSPAERARVRHHFVSFLDPDEDFSAGAFETQARKAIADLNRRGKTAVVAGGSGLYVSALLDGLFPGPGRNEALRARLHEEAEAGGRARLYARLQAVDPDYAAAIQPGDLRRIVRALEVHAITGAPLSVLHRQHRANTESLDAVQVALNLPRDLLYARINARVDAMLAQGLLDEVAGLLRRGYGPAIERLRSLGYREMAAHLRGEMPLEEAVELMKRNTRRFAKRQLTWFRGDPRVHWVAVKADTREDDLVRQALDAMEAPPDEA